MLLKRKATAEKERGAALVEAAIAIPILVLLMIGVMDFGLAYSDLATAQKSLRNTARYLSKLPQASLCGALSPAGKNLAVYGNTAGTGSPLISGWKANTIQNITITVTEKTTSTSTETTGCTTADKIYRKINISADVPYTALAWSVLRLPGAITMKTAHEERWIGQ